MYLSKSKPMIAKMVAIKMATETITVTKVKPIFCFKGLSTFTKGIPSPNSTGISIIQSVR